MKPSKNIGVAAFILYILEGGYVIIFERESTHGVFYVILIMVAFYASLALSYNLNEHELLQHPMETEKQVSTEETP